MEETIINGVSASTGFTNLTIVLMWVIIVVVPSLAAYIVTLHSRYNKERREEVMERRKDTIFMTETLMQCSSAMKGTEKALDGNTEAISRLNDTIINKVILSTKR